MSRRMRLNTAAMSAVCVVGVALVVLLSDDVRAFYCNNAALEDPSNYYCGYQRGNYVLRSNGVALIPSADDDDKAKLIVREPQSVGEVQERTLVSYGDILDFGDWGDARVGGIGSNPHINDAGQVVFQATTDYYDYETYGDFGNAWFGQYDAVAGLFASDVGGEPQFVAGSGSLLNGRLVCGSGIQPWPFMGNGGDFVFGATVADGRGACDREWNGDSNGNSIFFYGDTDYLALIDPTARITRIVAGPSADPTNANTSREVTIYYQELDGKSIDPAQQVSYRVNANRGLGLPNLFVNNTLGDPTLGANTNWTLTQDGTSGSFQNTAWSGSQFGDYLCAPAGCDIDLIASGKHAYISTSTSPTGNTQKPFYLGARLIGRGTVGSAGIETPLRAIQIPVLANEATQLTVAAANAAAVVAGNPLAVNGEVTFALRQASAISHSGRMVADDGSFVVFAGVQERTDDAPWGGEDFYVYPLGQNSGWNSSLGASHRTAVVHVDAAGAASLVGVTTPALAQLSGAQVTEAGEVLYRATSQRYSEDDWTYANQEACVKYTGLWRGASSGVAFPTGTGVARNGAWAVEGNLRLMIGGVQKDGWYSNVGRGRQTYVLLATDDPAADADYFMEVSNTQETSGGMYCSTAANVETVRAAIADGSARIAVNLNDFLGPMSAPQVAGQAEFAPHDVDLVVWTGATNTDPAGSASNRTYYETDGAIRRWSASTGVTSDIFRWNQTAPGGFALMRGTSPHFSSGGGVVGFKAGLWTPHMGFWGGSGGNPFPIYDSSNPVATILGSNFPCEATWDETLYGPYYDSTDEECDGIFVSEGGELKEIARTKKAELVFGSQSDASLVGVSEVDDFEFYEFGSAVAVSDTGTVFFNAHDNSGDKTAALPGQEVACTETELIQREGPSGSGGNGVSPPANHNRRLDGVFAYKGGVVEKVVAELDVITDSFGQQAIVMAIALPQPELRQAVGGDEILLKFAADTDGDCIEDVVGSMKAMAPQGMEDGQPSNTELYPDVGSFAAVNSSQGGRIRLAVADPTSGWVITRLEAISPDNATYLTAEEMNGSLLSFTAVMNPDGGSPGTLPNPMPSLDLEMEVEASVDRVIGLYKDLEAKPDLIAGITESASGGAVITFSIEDNGPYDADDTAGVATDPSGLSLEPLAALLPPYVPVPVMGQALMMILGGLMSLLGGFFAWRRQTL